MTRLCPSTYSSKQTTHSTCLPIYRFLAPEIDKLFSFGKLGGEDERPTIGGVAGITPEVVCDLGRDLEVTVCDADLSKGDVGDEALGEGT